MQSKSEIFRVCQRKLFLSHGKKRIVSHLPAKGTKGLWMGTVNHVIKLLLDASTKSADGQLHEEHKDSPAHRKKGCSLFSNMSPVCYFST